MKKLMAVFLIAGLCIFAVVANGSKEDVIKVGAMAPLTGSFAEHGKGFQTAFEMVIDEVNANGGINGKKLVMEMNDSEGDQKKAADIASKYAEDDEYVAMIGGFSSGCAMAAGPIADEGGLCFVSPTASNIAFTQGSDYCFSIPGISVVEGQVTGYNCCYEFCNAKSVYIFALNSDWGVSALEGCLKGLNKAGIEVLGQDLFVSGETDFSAMITKAKAANPDLYVILDQSPSILINQIRTFGVKTRIVTYGPSTSTELISLCGKNAEGLVTIGLTLDLTKDPGKAFAEEFEKRAGFAPTMWAAYAHVAASLTIDAIKACGNNITREAIRDNVAKTNADYLLGNMQFNEDGNRYIDTSNSPYKVSVVVDGVWVEQ